MSIRGIPLRAILIPVGVAVLSIAALVWYGLVKIPSQQRYLNEQNIRLLRTTSAQIQAKVNNFDLAIDNALESFHHGKRKGRITDDAFKAYVRMFVPDLDIVSEKDTCQKDSKPLYSDPPRVRIEVDEGTHYLELCYQHEVDDDAFQVSAKADIEQVVGRYLSSRNEFDTVVLADSRARVIAQYPTSGLKLSRLDQLTTASGSEKASQSKEPASKQNAVPPNALEAMVATGNIADVTIGGADYRLYVQPVQLSLKAETGDESEEWKLCGLVRMDHFRTASSAISSTYWLLMIAAFVVLCASIPILKLHVLNARERFHRWDAVSVAVSTFVIAGLLTFALLDMYYFGYASTQQTDQQLEGVAAKVQDNLTHEAALAREELGKLRTNLVDAARHPATRKKDPERPEIFFKDQARKLLECNPPGACRPSVLKGDPEIRQGSYPYFDIISGSDQSGQQRIKWTTKKAITPFIDLRDLAYFRDLQLAHLLKTLPQSGVSVIQSPNTGEPLTVFWEAIDGKNTELTALSLATNPISVGRPVLPNGTAFAILDTDGQVLFHSDPKRSLHENFFQEAGDDPRLRGIVLGRTKDWLNAEYLGGPHRLFVTPIVFEAGQSSFLDPQWTLVVFQGRLIAETVNLETVTLAGILFTGFGLVLALAWLVAYRLQPRSALKWFWPDHRKTARYRLAAYVNAIAAPVLLGLLAVESPAWVLVGTALVSLGALGMTFRIVTKPNPPSGSKRGWETNFMLARVLVLFVVTTAPAMACFKVAHDFEARLLNRHTHLDLLSRLNARNEGVERGTATLELCADNNPGGDCAIATNFLDERLKKFWDIHVMSLMPLDPSHRLSQPADWPDWLLSYVHLPYNSYAIELKSALFQTAESTPKGPRAWVAEDSGIVFKMGEIVKMGEIGLNLKAAPTGGEGLPLIAIAIVAGLCLWLLVRFAAGRLFVPDLYARPGVRALHDLATLGNLLLVGPPGSGKSRTLAAQPDISVFDVRTSGAWLNSGAPLTLPEDSTCAINHLEHRFEDASFRQNLLMLVEPLIYRRKCRVWIVSTRDPLEQLRETGATDLGVWQRLLQSFRLQHVGMTFKPDAAQVPEIARLVEEKTGTKKSPLVKLVLDECSFTPWLLSIAMETLERLPDGSPSDCEWADLLSGIALAAEPFYRGIWAACSKEEKLTLRQLAKEGVVNPCNSGVVGRLMRAGLVWRDPNFRLMNESFRRFVLQERQSEGLDALEHEGIQRPWSSVTATILTVAFGLIAVIVLTQQQLVESWLGYVPALAPAFPTLAKLVSGIQRAGKSTPEVSA